MLIGLVTLVLAGGMLEGPAMPQTLTPQVKGINDSAVLFFRAKRFDEAATMFDQVCAYGFATACNNANIAWINYAIEQEQACGSGNSGACATARDAAARACRSVTSTKSRENACELLESITSTIDRATWIDLTAPPSNDGCLVINGAANTVVNRCRRRVFAHFCTLSSHRPGDRCSNAGAGMSWGTFSPDTPAGAVPGKEPGEDLVYWYECYGGKTNFNSETSGANVVQFDRQTGWKGVSCTDSAGMPVAIVYRSTTRAGGIPFPGK